MQKNIKTGQKNIKENIIRARVSKLHPDSFQFLQGHLQQNNCEEFCKCMWCIYMTELLLCSLNAVKKSSVLSIINVYLLSLHNKKYTRTPNLSVGFGRKEDTCLQGVKSSMD